MFDRILGLPVHPLAVHGVVVLLPLMALVTVLIAVRRPWRDRLAWPVVVLNAGVAGMAFVAKESGEALARRMSGLDISAHEVWGKVVPITAIGLLLASVVLALTKRNTRWTPLALGLVLVTAAAATVWTIRAGHTGAEAVWGS